MVTENSVKDSFEDLLLPLLVLVVVLVVHGRVEFVSVEDKLMQRVVVR